MRIILGQLIRERMSGLEGLSVCVFLGEHEIVHAIPVIPEFPLCIYARNIRTEICQQMELNPGRFLYVAPIIPIMNDSGANDIQWIV